MTVDNDTLEVLEALTQKLTATSNRLAATEDTLLLVLKLIDHMDDDSLIIDGIRQLANMRRNTGDFDVAELLEKRATALETRAPTARQ